MTGKLRKSLPNTVGNIGTDWYSGVCLSVALKGTSTKRQTLCGKFGDFARCLPPKP